MVSAVVFLSQKDAENGLQDPQMALSRSLGALVAAAVAGLISDVIIAGPRGLELNIIADHAGCGFVEAEREADWLHRALALVKRPNCLMLRAGYIPRPGFIDELEDWRVGSHVRVGLFRAEPRNGFERLFPKLAPVVAAIAPLALWQAREAQNFASLTRALKGHTLRTRMMHVG